jgi:hypothetical protein
MQVSFRDSSPIRPGDEALAVIPDFFDWWIACERGCIVKRAIERMKVVVVNNLWDETMLQQDVYS